MGNRRTTQPVQSGAQRVTALGLCWTKHWIVSWSGLQATERDRLLLGLHDRLDVEAQGKVQLSREEHAQLEGIKTDIRPWKEWVIERKASERAALLS